MLGQGIAAGSGSEITPGQVLERGRIALGQDRSGNRLRDRSVAGSLWGRIAARSGSRIAPGQVLGRGRIALLECFWDLLSVSGLS